LCPAGSPAGHFRVHRSGVYGRQKLGKFDVFVRVDQIVERVQKLLEDCVSLIAHPIYR
jgi:hypothetical protein